MLYPLSYEGSPLGVGQCYRPRLRRDPMTGRFIRASGLRTVGQTAGSAERRA